MTGGGTARSVGFMNPIAFMEAAGATRGGMLAALADQPAGRGPQDRRAPRRRVRMRRRSLAATLAIAAGGLVLAGTAWGVDGTLEHLSQPSGVADPGTGDAYFAGVSRDGSRVFIHTAQKLTPEDTDTGRYDVYERAGGVTTLLSQPTGVADPNTDDVSILGASADGSRVFLQTTQKLTAGDTDTDRADVYERAGGVTTLVSQPTGVADPDSSQVAFSGASADGSRVFFETAQKLTADDGDSGGVDVYQRAGGVTTLVSQPSGVADPGTSDAFFAGASSDGSRVFLNTTQKLTAADVDTAMADVYERSGGTTTLVSQPTGIADPGTFGARLISVSDDGSRVLFETRQKLTAGDSDTNREDLYERAGGVTTLITQPTGVPDPDTDFVNFADASADGSRVFFNTTQKMTADDLDSGRVDAYVRAGGVTTLVTGPTGVSDPDSAHVSIGTASADGNRFSFETTQKLTADDVDGSRTDVYERAGGVTTLVSRPTDGPDPNSGEASFRAISANGGRVFFETDQKLTPDDTDAGRNDVYERAGGVTTLISKPTDLADPDTGSAYSFAVSSGGNRVIFETVQRMTASDNDGGRTDVYAAGSPDPAPDPGPDPSPTPEPNTPTSGDGPSPSGLLPGPCANERRGTRGRDLLDGTAAGDVLRGLAGADRLNGLAGDDCLFGGAGNDRLTGGRGQDRLSGGRGVNSISAGPGNDVVNSANRKAERIVCGRGRDRVRADRRDTLKGCERIRRV